MPDFNLKKAKLASSQPDSLSGKSHSGVASSETEQESLVASIALRIRQSLDLESILQQTVDEVRQFLKTDRVSIYRFEPDFSGVIAVESVADNVSSVLGHKINDPCLKKKHLDKYQQGEIQAVDDLTLARLSPCYQKMLSEFGVKAKLIVPIIASDKLWGLMIAHHCQSPRQWQPSEITLLKQLATQVGIAVQQAELYDRVQSLNAYLEQRIDLRTASLQNSVKFETLIRKITEKIRDSLDEQQILETVTREIGRVLQVERCKIEIYSADRSTVKVAHEYGNMSSSCQGSIREVADFPELDRQLLQKQSLQFVEHAPELTQSPGLNSGRDAFASLVSAELESRSSEGADRRKAAKRLRLCAQRPFQGLGAKHPLRSCASATGTHTRPRETMEHSFRSESPLPNLPEDLATRLVCPIFDDRGTIGNLWLLRAKEAHFTSAEIVLVEQVANQCAIAIRQARLYQQSQIQVAELERLNLLKDDFLKTISHELKTPMSSIQLASETLEALLEQEIGSQRSATFTKVLNIFRSACDRQSQLVNDLLTLCYIDAQKKMQTMQWIDLSVWLPQIIEPFIDRVEQQRQHLKLDLDANLPQLKSDISTIKRIINELLNNACKYTPAGETITLKATAVEGQIRIGVHNTGIEIPLQEQQRVFDKFYRIPNRDPWQFGGTGIGLSLVKNLLESLGGQIHLTSNEVETAFILDFPRQEDADEGD